MPETTEATQISRVEVDTLDALLGIPGADNITTGVGAISEKPGFFGRQKPDLSFIDKTEKIPASPPTPATIIPDDETAEAKTARLKKEEADKATKVIADAKLAEQTANKGKNGEDLATIIAEEEQKSPEEIAAALAAEEAAGKGGRPKVDKDGMIELTKKFIEKGLMVPFEGDKPIEEYNMKDIEELIEANFKDRETKIKESTPVEFFDALPPELQIAAKYVADGGKDMKGIFRVLAQAEETRSLDPTNVKDHEPIIREYLRATNFGTEDDIQEEITGWKDMNKLAEKAAKFKPKLDQMQEGMIAQKLVAQENARKQEHKVAQTYMNSVYETLKPGELAGLKLDKKTQSLLYTGLVAPNYPSISGKNTNLLGHLLEKYQYVEPNHAIIAEALWLLSDPEAYKSKVRESAKTEAAAETARRLKTEESTKGTGANGVIEDSTKTKQRTIQRNNSNFFARI